MTEPLRLGIAGLGTVGAGVVKIVQRHADLLAARAGRPITIVRWTIGEGEGHCFAPVETRLVALIG